jgi:hypothetical protein
MATAALVLVNGQQRMQSITASAPAIYDQPLTVVVSGAGANQINGPVTTGASVTLPASGTYTGQEMQIYLNGDRMEPVFDYTYVGSGSGKTQVQFTFDLVVGDRIDFRVDRAP